MIKNTAICLVVILTVFSFLLSGCVASETDNTIPPELGDVVFFEVAYTILLEADLSNVADANKAADMAQLNQVISTRLRLYNGKYSNVQQQGENRILVELPGDVDIEAIKSLLTTVGFLEFREVEQSATGTLVTLRDYLSGTVNDFFDKEETTPRLFVNETSKEEDYGRLITVLTIDETGLKFSDAVGNNMEKEELNVYSDLHSWIPSRGNDSTPLTVALLDDAQPAINPWTENPEIDIQWNEQGTIIFDEIAARLYNPAETYSLEHVLGIFLDKKLLSAPQIRAFKFEGKCTISSEFTLAEAEELANIMKSHALSIPVTIVEIIER